MITFLFNFHVFITSRAKYTKMQKKKKTRKYEVPLVLLVFRDKNHCEHFVNIIVELWKHAIEMDSKH